MIKEFKIEGLGDVVYEESVWTGKKKITVNGIEIAQQSKNVFGDGENTITVNGSVAMGITLSYREQSYCVLPKIPGYVIFLALLPLIFDLIW